MFPGSILSRAAAILVAILLVACGGYIWYQQHSLSKALIRAVEAETEASQYRGSLMALQATVESSRKAQEIASKVVKKKVLAVRAVQVKAEVTEKAIYETIKVDEVSKTWFDTPIPDGVLLDLDEDTEPLGDRGK